MAVSVDAAPEGFETLNETERDARGVLDGAGQDGADSEVWLFRLPPDLTASDLNGLEIKVDSTNGTVSGAFERESFDERMQQQKFVRYAFEVDDSAAGVPVWSVFHAAADSERVTMVPGPAKLISVARTVALPDPTDIEPPEVHTGAPYAQPDMANAVFQPFGSTSAPKSKPAGKRKR